MRTEALLYTIISSIGLGLNIIVGSIITIGLKVNNIELIISLIITIIDSIFYVNNIVHIIFTSDKQIINGAYISLPEWYNNLNIIVPATTVLSSVSLVTILSIIRYVRICLCKNVPSSIWIFISIPVICLSLILSSIPIYFFSFRCSPEDFFCSPDFKNISKENLLHTMIIAYSLYVISFILQLPIIVFCYYKVTSAYLFAVRPRLYNLLIPIGSIRSNQYNLGLTNQRSIPYNVEERKREQHKIKVKRIIIVVKMSLFIIAYMVCLLPDIIICITNLVTNNLAYKTNIISNCLICCASLISASFVLLFNVQVQDLIRHFFTSLVSILPSVKCYKC